MGGIIIYKCSCGYEQLRRYFGDEEYNVNDFICNCPECKHRLMYVVEVLK